MILGSFGIVLSQRMAIRHSAGGGAGDASGRLSPPASAWGRAPSRGAGASRPAVRARGRPSHRCVRIRLRTRRIGQGSVLARRGVHDRRRRVRPLGCVHALDRCVRPLRAAVSGRPAAVARHDPGRRAPAPSRHLQGGEHAQRAEPPASGPLERKTHRPENLTTDGPRGRAARSRLAQSDDEAGRLRDQSVQKSGDRFGALQRGAAGQADVDRRDVCRLDGQMAAVVAAQRQPGHEPDAQPLPHVREQQRHAGDVDRRQRPQAQPPQQLVQDAAPLAPSAEAQQGFAAESGPNGLGPPPRRARRDPEEALGAQARLVRAGWPDPC